MKNYLIIFIIFHYTTLFASSLDIKYVSISGNFENKYIKNQKVEFNIKNETDNVLYFYCSVEKNINGIWREIIPSIDSTEIRKSVKLNRLMQREEKKITWIPEKQDFYFSGIQYQGEYHILINIYEELNAKRINIISSDSFDIE